LRQPLPGLSTTLRKARASKTEGKVMDYCQIEKVLRRFTACPVIPGFWCAEARINGWQKGTFRLVIVLVY
jgi:hypothetical protein